MRKGNQVRNLSDPVTVTEERFSESIVRAHEKERRSEDSGARKPAEYGEVKLPCKVYDQFWRIRSSKTLSAFS